jgi:hypothetical protein
MSRLDDLAKNTPLVMGVLALALTAMTPESFSRRGEMVTFVGLSLAVGLAIEFGKWAFPRNTQNAQTPAREVMQRLQQNLAAGAAPR